MERERWQQIEQLYHSALRLEESARRAFLEDTCKEEALRQEVESLLACDWRIVTGEPILPVIALRK